ncbi:MAG: hypothetical protein ACRDKS_16685 [Actinomycetota bacterium]
MQISKRLITAVLAAMPLLAACGGDSKPSGATNTPPPTSATFSGSANALFSTAECLQVAQALAAASTGGFGAGSLAPDDAVATLQRLESAAPSAIKADLVLIATELRTFYEALKTAGADFANPNTFTNPQTLAAAGQAASAFQTSGAPQAQERIASYFDQVCPGAR